MKKILIFLSLFFIACGTAKHFAGDVIFFYRVTADPLSVIDSIGKANKLTIVDTTYWSKLSQIASGQKYKTYLWTQSTDKSVYILSIGKFETEKEFELRFRIENE
jgi:hypothetical protein